MTLNYSLPEIFVGLLNELWEVSFRPSHIKGGFHGSGLYPLSRAAIHPSKLATAAAFHPQPSEQQSQKAAQPETHAGDSGTTVSGITVSRGSGTTVAGASWTTLTAAGGTTVSWDSGTTVAADLCGKPWHSINHCRALLHKVWGVNDTSAASRRSLLLKAPRMEEAGTQKFQAN